MSPDVLTARVKNHFVLKMLRHKILGAINGGRQTCRTRSHNHHVVHQILERLADADSVGELPVGGIAQKQHRAAGDDGRIGLRHPEILEQPVHIRVGFDVHPREEDAIFRKEITNPEGIRGVTRPNQPQAGEVGGLAQKLPATITDCR